MREVKISLFMEVDWRLGLCRNVHIVLHINIYSANLANIFRAIMGLYIALSIFWVVGAFKRSLRLAALWSMTIFMTGIALGRILSIIIDGFPYPIFLFYTGIEIFSALIGFYLIKNSNY